jgi:Ca2+-binding EF-hand superfamily protein
MPDGRTRFVNPAAENSPAQPLIIDTDSAQLDGGSTSPRSTKHVDKMKRKHEKSKKKGHGKGDGSHHHGAADLGSALVSKSAHLVDSAAHEAAVLVSAGVHTTGVHVKTLVRHSAHMGREGISKLVHHKKHDSRVEDPRIEEADETFRRLFRMIDYNRDHSLMPGELLAGMQVLENMWGELTPLYACSKADFARNRQSTQAQCNLYEKLVDELEDLHQETLLERAKSSWGKKESEVPAPDATSKVVELIYKKYRALSLGTETVGERGTKRVKLSDEQKEELQELEGGKYSAAVARAKALGISPDSIEAAAGWADDKEGLRAQVYEAELADLCTKDDVMGLLFPCTIAVTTMVGGKLPSSLPFCKQVREMLDEDVQAVEEARGVIEAERKGEKVDDDATEDVVVEAKISHEKHEEMITKFLAAQETEQITAESVHPEFDKLLGVLTDPYLVHIVLPQLESWQMLFNIFDLRRNGRVSYSELQQGLSTSCSPEIEIVQTSGQVQDLLNSMTFAVKEQELVDRVIGLCVDDPGGFGSREATSSACQITLLRKSNPSAVHHCADRFEREWKSFTRAVRQCAEGSITRSDLGNLDTAVYGLRYVTHTLTARIGDDLSGSDSEAQKLFHKTPGLREELFAFRRDLSTVIKETCTEVLDSHAQLYHLLNGDARSTQHELMRKFAADYLLRRRRRMIKRVEAWETAQMKKRKGVLSLQNKDSPLVRLQAKARGAIERSRIEKLKAEAAEDANTLDSQDDTTEDNSAKDNYNTTIDYFDWPRVLIHYLRSQEKVDSMRKAVEKMFILKQSQQKEHEEPLEFPHILLDGVALESKLTTLRQTIHHWNELLMMLDQNNSGYLNPMELRSSIMAFSEMGLITELKEFQPCDCKFAPFRERVDDLSEIHAGTRLGWNSSTKEGTADDEAAWKGRQNFRFKAKIRAPVPDYPLYTKPGDVLLLGEEGIPVDRHPWVCCTEFQYDSLYAPDQDGDTSKFSVLISSYRNNALVAKRCGTKEKPGIQLLFMPKTAFADPAHMLAQCEHYATAGRRQAARAAGAAAKAAGAAFTYEKDDDFPLGHGTYEITPFIPMEQLRWYALMIQGDEMAPESPGSADHLYKIRVRIDPIGSSDTWDATSDDPEYHRNDMDDSQDPTLDPQDPTLDPQDPTLETKYSPRTQDRLKKLEQYAAKPRSAGKTTWHDYGNTMLEYNQGAYMGEVPKTEKNSEWLVQPWFCTEWQGIVDFKDIYSLGNTFDNLCSDASDDVEWSVGALRNFVVVAYKRPWYNKEVYVWPQQCNRDEDGNAMTKSHDGTPRKGGVTSPRIGTTSPRSPRRKTHRAKDSDLRYWIQECLNSKDYRVKATDGTSWKVQGKYKLTVSPRKARNGRILVKFQNDINTDHEAGFPYSNEVVNRFRSKFLHHKLHRTSDLIKSLMGSVPPEVASFNDIPQWARRTKGGIPHWCIPEEFAMDSNTLFQMRGATARDDAALNVLFTGAQLQSAMKHLTRNVHVNKRKCKIISKFFLWPFGECCRHVTGRSKRKTQKGSGNNYGAYATMIWYLRKTFGTQPRGLIYMIVLLWLLGSYAVVGSLYFNLSALHQLEPVIAISYYVWASLFLALEVATEVSKLPSETPFKLAYKQANLAMIETELTRIDDGQRVRVTAMGFLGMVCRLHVADEEVEEEEEEEEEADEEEDPFSVGRSTLDAIWKQSKLTESHPFADDEATPSDVIYDYEVKGEVLSPLDWDEKNLVYMKSMHTRIDTGMPTPKGIGFVAVLALMNASIGMFHRWSTNQTVIGDPAGEGSIVLCCSFVTFVSSFVVYFTVFRVAFQWYIVLEFMTQLAAVLGIEGAMINNLPCYLDLRHEGNLEGWYCARDYLNAYCNAHICKSCSPASIAHSRLACSGKLSASNMALCACCSRNEGTGDCSIVTSHLSGGQLQCDHELLF